MDELEMFKKIQDDTAKLEEMIEKMFEADDTTGTSAFIGLLHSIKVHSRVVSRQLVKLRKLIDVVL